MLQRLSVAVAMTGDVVAAEFGLPLGVMAPPEGPVAGGAVAAAVFPVQRGPVGDAVDCVCGACSDVDARAGEDQFTDHQRGPCLAGDLDRGIWVLIGLAGADLVQDRIEGSSHAQYG